MERSSEHCRREERQGVTRSLCDAPKEGNTLSSKSVCFFVLDFIRGTNLTRPDGDDIRAAAGSPDRARGILPEPLTHKSPVARASQLFPRHREHVSRRDSANARFSSVGELFFRVAGRLGESLAAEGQKSASVPDGNPGGASLRCKCAWDQADEAKCILGIAS